MIKNNLKRIRQEKKLTQLALSIKTEIQQSDLSQVENGLKQAFPKWKTRISEALGEPEEVIFPEEQLNQAN